MEGREAARSFALNARSARLVAKAAREVETLFVDGEWIDDVASLGILRIGFRREHIVNDRIRALGQCM